jgi:hypothetical protein
LSWASSGSSSSPVPSSPRRPAVTSWVESCLVHKENFPGVNYYL